jgi:hypothetical protein
MDLQNLALGALLWNAIFVPMALSFLGERAGAGAHA